MNKIERNSLIIDERVLYYIINPDLQEDEDNEDKELQTQLSQFELVDTKIVSHDEYDGGAQYDSIIKDKIYNKFYSIIYNDWDLNRQDSYGPYDEDSITLDNTLFEVFPKEKVIITYE